MTAVHGTAVTLLFALLLAPASLVPLPAQGIDKGAFEELKRLFREATALAKEKKPSQSNAKFAHILERLPPPPADGLDHNRAQVRYSMARNAAALGRAEDACAHLSASIDRGFWDADAMLNDARLSALRGRPVFAAVVEKAHRALARLPFGRKDLAGEAIRAEEYAGKVLVIDIWGTWCRPCRNEVPHFIELQKKHRARGLRIIGVTWERRAPDATVEARVKKFAEEAGVNYRLLLATPALIRAIPRLRGYPTTIIVGRDGSVRHRFFGYRDYDILESTLEPLLGEKPPARAAGEKH